MKGKFDTYQSTTISIAKQYSRVFKVKPKSLLEPLKAAFEKAEYVIQSMDCFIFAEEYHWREHSRYVIYPESLSVLEKLTAAKFSIDKSTGIQFPHESYLLSFPLGYEICGYQASGCLITVMRYNDRPENILYPFFKALGQLKPRLSQDNFSDDKMILNLTYANPIDHANPPKGFTKGDVLAARMTIDVDKIPAALAAKTLEEYSEIVGTYVDISDGSAGTYNKSLSKVDLEYQFNLLKIIVKSAVYSVNCSGALVDGYPDVKPKKLEPKLEAKYKTQKLGISSEIKRVESEHPHYRSWHFRQLSDKRFYQGEHAKKPIGSRVVFVKDSMVGGSKISAETLTKSG